GPPDSSAPEDFRASARARLPRSAPPSQPRRMAEPIPTAPASDSGGTATRAIAGIPRTCTRSVRRLPRIPMSLRAPAQQDDLDRLEHDQNVQTERRILDIEQVVLQLFLGVLYGITVLVANLRPAGNPGPHGVADPVIRNFLAEPLHKFRTLRPRSHKSHIALEHAPQLRNLIDARHSQKLADPGNSRIFIVRPGRPGVGLRVLPHRAELVAVEVVAGASPSLLAVKHRPFGIQLDR